METGETKNWACRPETTEELGDRLMHEIGGLDAASDELKGTTDGGEIAVEEVGRWITAIGKAVLAIFGK